MALTEKQKRFVSEYLVDLNATQAAIRSGYAASAARTLGSRHLSNPEVAESIRAGQAAAAASIGVTAERIVREYALLGFANMADYLTEAGSERALDFSKLTRDQAAAICEMTVETYVEGKGEAAETVKRTKFKLADKKGSLDSLARHLGMFTDKSEVRVLDPLRVDD